MPGFLAGIERRLASGSLRRLLQLYAAKGLQASTPLFVTLVVARELGPAEFGRYATSQAIAVIAAIFIELGLNLSATRQAVMEPSRAAALAADVVALKAKISVMVAVLFACSVLLGFWDDPSYAAASAAYAIGFGNSLFWYALAQRKTRAIASAEFVAAAFVVPGLLIWALTDNRSGPTALAVVAVGPWLSLVTTALLTRVKPPSIKQLVASTGFHLLKTDTTAFTYRGANTLYNNSLILVLPLFATRVDVGVLAFGLRIFAIISQAVAPAHQMLVTEAQRRKTSLGRQIFALRSSPSIIAIAVVLAIGVSLFVITPTFQLIGAAYAAERAKIVIVLLSGVAAVVLQTASISAFVVDGRFGTSATIYGALTLALALSSGALYTTWAIQGVVLMKGVMELVVAVLLMTLVASRSTRMRARLARLR